MSAATDGDYAVGAFNINHLETLLAVIEAVEEEKKLAESQS